MTEEQHKGSTPVARGRERRSRKSSSSSSSSRRDVCEYYVFGNQRVMTFSLIAMVICIVEFQAIHEARVQHKKLRELHEREQATLVAIENDIRNVVFQQATSGEQTAINQIEQHAQKIPNGLPPLLQHQNLPIEQEPSDFAQRPSQPGKQQVETIEAIRPLHVQEQQQQSKPQPKSQWNLPAPSANPHLIPPELANLADLSTPYVKSDKELPFFWHVPKSGGTSVKHMYSDCYQLVEACESGIAEGHLRDITLKVVTLESGWKFLNVDTTTPRGIERAARFNIVRSGKADLVVSPLPHDLTPAVFTNKYRGRFFAIFRDPLERVVSLFYYLQTAEHEPTYNPELKKMTLEQYVSSDLAESNFVSRTLINKMTAPLEEQDFAIAKEILRSKCLVGLLDQLEESVRRFDLYFGFPKPTDDPICAQKYTAKGSNKQSSRPAMPTPDTAVYQNLKAKNHMDVRLHDFARQLFAEQAAIFTTKV